ncbi:AAA family ATPase [Pseudoalteromonas sp. T1lg24]|uniref:AAA family ATPase n=1 Tax=Pseudoalteromonas sp. T1lg24 TaxID=2077099 RepID=UPI000CF6EAD8|nr:AAA family ATPase [Pseudoalteromonas sp. T1lg24]
MKILTSLRELEEKVIDYYFNSGDFNGISISNLIDELSITFLDLSILLSRGIEEDRLRVTSSDFEMNPHIIRQGFPDKLQQLSAIKEDNIHHTCVYPSKSLAKAKLSSEQWSDSPFKRMLAEGIGQLEIIFFDLELLDFYRRDPRYFYECNDIGGRICIKDDYYLSESTQEKDKILLKAFGIAYDDDFNRYLAAFVSDVADLSQEHQNIWKSKLVEEQLKVHPDFYGSQILGRWPTHISVFDAVLYEQKIINAMVNKIGKPNLFKSEFGKYLESKPQEFAFLLRPTIQEYESFIHLLDKIMSDNINKKFFKGELHLEQEIERRDGKVQVVPKGTIQLLDEWLRKNYNSTDWSPWDFAISVFKKIRKQRQSPAHSITENKYDKSLVQEQRGLMQEVYEALMILRHALSNHPLCKDYDFDIPQALIEGKIWMV